MTLGGRAWSAVKVYAREVSIVGEIYGPIANPKYSEYVREINEATEWVLAQMATPAR